MIRNNSLQKLTKVKGGFFFKPLHWSNKRHLKVYRESVIGRNKSSIEIGLETSMAMQFVMLYPQNSPSSLDE